MLEVLTESIAYLAEIGSFLMEETVAFGAIFVIDGLVEFLGSKADGAPFVLEGLDLLRHLIKLLGIEGLSVHEGFVNGFELGDDRALAVEVLLLFGVQFVKESLMFLIDDSGSLFEAVPKVLPEFTRYGTYLCPFIVELLECAAGLDDVLVALQPFCGFAEKGLHLEVLLEIEVPQLNIDLHEVIELLLIALVSLTQLLHLWRRYLADGLPFGLQVTHALEVGHHAVGLALRERFHLLEDSLLACEIILLLFGYLRGYLCAFGFVLRQQLFKLLL